MSRTVILDRETGLRSLQRSRQQRLLLEHRQLFIYLQECFVCADKIVDSVFPFFLRVSLKYSRETLVLNRRAEKFANEPTRNPRLFAVNDRYPRRKIALARRERVVTV